MSWLFSFLVIYVTLFFGFCAQYFFGGYAGLITVSIILFLYLYIDTYYYQKILDWIQILSVNGRAKHPKHTGKYRFFILPIYKAVRRKALDAENTQQLNQSILWAANAFPAAVVILDKNNIIRWSNRQAKTLLNIDYKKDLGQSVFSLIANTDVCDYIRTSDGARPLHIDERLHGRRYHLQFELSRYSSNNTLLLCFDNTQLETLRTTQQDFVANVSHELRTPLTVLIGFLETLRDLPPEAISDEQRKHFEGLMQEQASRMLAIVTDLLTLSKLESTQLTESMPVTIASIIEQARIQAEAISKDQHVFTLTIDPHLAVNGNAHELSSAITNLLTNAVRYTPPHGTIDVYWGMNELGEAVFSVTDSGLGIDAQHIPRITERFYRVDKSRSRASGGTGLGLAITKHIAIRHKARLHIESKLNEGSTFSLIFPKDSISI